MLSVAVLIPSVPAQADEGMWLVNAIDKALEKNMRARGLKLKAKEIYNADAPGATISDAIVSMEFGCTGSMISKDGLLITNHHCAYGDVYNLSMQGETNYLEDGFWAMKSTEEVNIPGKSVFFLDKVIDVSDEVAEIQKKAVDRIGHPYGGRKLSSILESKYTKETGKEAMLYSMWRGSVYYIALYTVYSDVRLVAAPPVSISAFGGDIDNWEWPQHKCDFAMYRIYTAPDGTPATYSEDNVPMHPQKYLKIAKRGVKEGDFTMILGYPGRTDRYGSSYGLSFGEHVKLPIQNELRGHQMAIIKDWMARDEKIKLMYSDYFFTLSNFQEYGEGEQKCYGRFGCARRKKNMEDGLQSWIESDQGRQARWGSLIDDLERAYDMTADVEKNMSYYRETLVRGMYFSRILLRSGNARKISQVREVLDKEKGSYDLRVERDLFVYALGQYVNNVDRKYQGTYQKQLIDSMDIETLASYLWDNSILTSRERFDKFAKENERKGVDERAAILTDPLIRFCAEVKITDFRHEISDMKDVPDINDLNREYTQALYQMRLDKKTPQYPDANSSMRITYGIVGGLEPYDGIKISWQSKGSGILEKYDPSSFDYKLDDKQRSLLQQNPDIPVNFLTDNDITGGNSGSPVLNAKGELVGLAFDGNKESLAGNADYVDGYNKCVCVDIRYVLWILDKYAGMQRILDEIR